MVQGFRMRTLIVGVVALLCAFGFVATHDAVAQNQRVTFNVQNRRVVGNTYFVEVWATMPAGQNWRVGASNIRVNFNNTALDPIPFSGTGSNQIFDGDPTLNTAPYDGMRQVYTAGSFITMTIPILPQPDSGYASKTGSFRVGTLRFDILNGNLQDNITFRTPPGTNTMSVFNSNTSLTFTSGCGAGTCYDVQNPTSQFVFQPVITGLSPALQGQGGTVTISGSNLTGATAVSFGGVAAQSFTVVDATTITAVVATGASGDVSVTTPNGTATFAGFTFFGAPSLLSPAADACVFATSSVVNVDLDWSDVAGATDYNIQVSNDPTFATTLVNLVLPTSALVGASVPRNQRLHFRARAQAGISRSAYSASQTFYLAQEPVVPSGMATVCEGDTVTYTSLPAENPSNVTVNWSVTGGTIVGSSTGTSVSVAWGPSGTPAVTATWTYAGSTCTRAAVLNVTRNPLPTSFAVGTTTATICSGANATITLSGSQSGTNYQLRQGASNVGSAVAGTGAPLNFTVTTPAIGTQVYNVVATTSNGCSRPMAGSASVLVNPLPALHTVTSTTANICAGQNASIGLDGSVVGTNYQLVRDGSNVGAPVAGTGSAIVFPAQTLSTGSYVFTVRATIVATGCGRDMTGSATVVVSPLPMAYTVQSGKTSYCEGEAVTVGLSNSQTGVNYTLLRDGTPVSTVAGTGAALNFAAITGLAVANYIFSVNATTVATGCTNAMSNTLAVQVVGSPSTANVTTSTPAVCEGGTIVVNLSASQVGVNYQVQRGGANFGSALPGTGSALMFTFTNATTGSNSFTVVATNGVGCVSTMTGTATIEVNALPTTFNVGAVSVSVLVGQPAQVTLSGSQTGVEYQLVRDGANVGSPVNGTGGAIQLTNTPTNAGTYVYTVVARRVTTGCTRTMTGSTSIQFTLKPLAQTVTNPVQSVPLYGTGVINLAGSELGVNYYLDGCPTCAPVAGTGGPINIPGQNGLTSAVTYQVYAQNSQGGDTTHCMPVVTMTPEGPAFNTNTITFSAVTTTSIGLTLTLPNPRGDGRVILARQGATPAPPLNNTTYTSNTDFSACAACTTAAGTKVVGDITGTANTLTVTGLTTRTSYTFRACEYNTVSGQRKYNVRTALNNPRTRATLKLGALSEGEGVAALGPVMPNPSNGQVSFTLNASEEALARIVVIDASGREVLTVNNGTVLSIGDHTFNANLAGYAAGTYAVVVYLGDEVTVQPFVVVP